VNVISDVGVAAASARAALDGALLNVEVNLAAMKDEKARTAVRNELETHARALTAADEIVVAVRERISR
jgi:methenyltetrahydrofolate cyclohydrolase